MATTLDRREIAHFAEDSAHWWNADGPFAPLHRLGSLRLDYLRTQIEAHSGRKADVRRPFAGLRLLDIGCGGGLVAEPLARLGGAVTGIDADAQAIAVARAHAKGAGLTIDYRDGAAEDVPDDEKWDVVLALEIVEHVADLAYFVETAAKLCRPGGLVVISTLNRTKRAYALGIVAAENILRWVPAGTHDWKKFVKPSELAAAGRGAGLRSIGVTGYRWSPRTRGFVLCGDDVAVNYFMTLEKAR